MGSGDGRWKLRRDEAATEGWRSAGLIPDRTILSDAIDRMAEDPDRVIVVDPDGSTFTRREIFELAERIAGALRGRGLQPGDVVSFQVPNWHESLAINLAANMGGFVLNPVMPIYRDAETQFMLKDSRAKAVFIPSVYRNFDYVDMFRRLKPNLPDLEHVIVLRGDPGEGTSFEALAAEAPPIDAVEVDPDSVKLLMYTSGTTGRAKGVLHSHNSLGAEVRAQRDYWSLTEADVMFMPSPVAHITGVLDALELPWVAGMKVILLDIWNAGRAVDLMRDHEATIAVTATPFLAEVLNICEASGEKLPAMRIWPCGGSAVPVVLVRRSNAYFPNCLTFRSYGSTEAPTVTMGVPSRDELDLAAETDGQIFRSDLRIRDADSGLDLPENEEGEIVVKAPEMFLGYSDPQDNLTAFWPDGFFRSGDLGKIVHGDRVIITGRIKDLIIRGGENLSAKEIEDALMTHPAIDNVAIVGMPSARMGETVCAFVIAKPDATVDLRAVAAHLDAQGFARQKIPEHVELVTEFPCTASGKVKKDVLRQQAKAFVRADA